MFRLLTQKLNTAFTEKYDTNKYPILLLNGARRVGKSTLLKNTFPDAKYINVEETQFLNELNSRNSNTIANLITSLAPKSRQIILDEFQRLEDPGLIAKVIFDEIPNTKIILSGSSSLEISNKASESLTGRKKTFHLYPLTLSEYLIQTGLLKEINENLTLTSSINKSITREAFSPILLERLKLGLYPVNKEVLDIETYLKELVDAYLLKDLLYLDLVRNSGKFRDLLTLLALQIGQIVNVSDLATRLKIDRETCEKYINVLENMYVIFKLYPYRNKRRDEIGLSYKVYFTDVGIRNALLNSFGDITKRSDLGNIFENFVISEFIKLNYYYNLGYDFRYWRTKNGSEVDLVLTKNLSPIKAFEIKYTYPKQISSAFSSTYPECENLVVTKDNILEYLA